MRKEDITKTIITISFRYRAKNNRIVKDQFPISLQQWIKMSPDKQDNYVAQHAIGKVITHDVID